MVRSKQVHFDPDRITSSIALVFSDDHVAKIRYGRTFVVA